MWCQWRARRVGAAGPWQNNKMSNSTFGIPEGVNNLNTSTLNFVYLIMKLFLPLIMFPSE